MGDPREHLTKLIADFLEQRLGFTEFQQRYSTAYADEEADRDFSGDDIDFYGLVHERAEWTTQNPSAQERIDGWQDQADFTEWLQSFVRSRTQ